MSGSFELAFSTTVCAATMRVEIFAWDLGASLSYASAFFPFTLLVVVSPASEFVSSSASVSSFASSAIGSASSAMVKLFDLGLDIGDGGHECLYL